MPDDSEERRDVPGPAPAEGGRRPSRSSLLVGLVVLAVVAAGVALGLTLSRADPGARQASCGATAPKLSVVGTGQATVSPDLLSVVVQVDAGGPSAAAALATDNADAARALQMPAGSARRLLHQARKTLRHAPGLAALLTDCTTAKETS